MGRGLRVRIVEIARFWQNLEIITDMTLNERKKCGIKGSHFPDEHYDFENTEDKLLLFVEMLKNRGCYIADDGHIRSKKGGLMSKLTRNGYWLTGASYNRKDYYFCEHRVIWVWHNGAIPQGLEINHIDYNRGNNRIENLEIVTRSENLRHSADHMKGSNIGEKSGRAKLTDKQAEAIKTLGVVCGWSPKQIQSVLQLDDMHTVSIGRIVRGERYPHITPGEILEVYPTIVEFTQNKDISAEEELKDYSMGLCGEVGELVDLFKKMLYHGKEVDPVEILLELGDIMYYLTAISNVLGLDLDLVALNNNAKLMARYPNGFSVVDSLNRIEDVDRANLNKLSSRQERGVIEGYGDNR